MRVDGERNRGGDREQQRLQVRELCVVEQETANTIEARPRGTNQPMNARVGRRAPVPSSTAVVKNIAPDTLSDSSRRDIVA